MRLASRPTRPRRPTALRVQPLEAREVPASLSGRVFLDYDNSGTFNGPDAGLPGVTITLTNTSAIPRLAPWTTTTDAQGNYSFTGLPEGFYTVTETQPTAPDVRNGRSVPGVGGSRVIVDSSGPVLVGYGLGVAGVDEITHLSLTATASATGFNFTEIPLVDLGGFVFEDVNANGAKDPGEPVIAGVAVTLTAQRIVTGPFVPPTVTTDADGAYTFTDLLPGTYTITETQPGAYSDGLEQSGLSTAAVGPDRFSNIDLMAVTTTGPFNFGETKAGTLSGVVFDDVNGGGIQTAGEPGIAGVKVVLTGSEPGTEPGTLKFVSRRATTGADGSYTFNNLGAGRYTVSERQPAGYTDGADRAGSLGGTIMPDRVAVIVFPAGATATGYTFAERAMADLSLTRAPVSTVLNANGTVTLTYTVRNRGAAPAPATTVRMNFGGLTFVSASAPGAFDPTTRMWTVGDLAAGATATIRVTLRGTVGGTYHPSARALTPAAELGTANNVVASTIVPPPVAPTRGGLAGLLTTLNQYPALTRLWLVSRLLG